MIWKENRAGRWLAFAALAVVASSPALWPLEARAQATPEPPAAAVVPATDAGDEGPATDVEEPEAPAAGALSPEELQALVAPIALYPDLVLVLALQASLAPLDIVQADRFLADYDEDPSLTPNPDWDQSVVGLLNYPTVIHTMNADLDWTQSLGQAVLDQLEGVQDAIQDVRTFMRAVGGLESNDKMTVIVEDDNISIRPTDQNAVFIPQYDPEALLTALYSTDVTAPAAEPSPEGAEASPEAAAAAVPSESAAPAEGAAEPAPAPAPAPEMQAVPAAAPTYPPPGYYPPPPMTYSDPSPSWLGTAATFAGGAVVGGLVGWAIADDDDDHHDNGDSISRGNVNIEDSTITVNRGGGRGGAQGANADNLKLRAENERLKQDARVKEQREETKRALNQKYAQTQQPAAGARAAVAPATRSKHSGLATSGGREATATTARRSAGGKEATGRVEQARAKAAPTASARARPATSKATVRPGDRKQPQVASAFGSTKSATEAKRDSNRGLKSRTGAKTEVKPARGGGKSVFAQSDGGAKAAASGKQSGRQSRRGKR